MMKAHYIMAEAHLELHNHEDALVHAVRAHKLCVVNNDKSLPQVTALVLRCKKERWEEMEKKRVREGQDLERELVELMEREREDMVATCEGESDRAEVSQEWDNKIAQLKTTFELARIDTEKKREVPDWAVDDISFGIMVDPVMVSLV
jgi:STIP1 homology and U-box containing protein 1